jgi:transposase-like protein
MTKPIARDPIYRQRAFDADIIQLCVRWYVTYRLSYRDLVEMMAERGIKIAHSTILRWVTRYVPEFEKRWNRFSKTVGTSWRVDETYISIKAKWHYLYRLSTSTARPSISCFAATGVSQPHKHFFARHSRPMLRACRAR